MTHKICIIGAGPCGVSALFHFDKLGGDAPEVICYEKGSTWLGLWNLTWMTGTDEFGEPCHGSMYKHLWANGPKELMEYPDYTYEDHFGKATPSCPPRLVVREYLEARLIKKSRTDLRRYIKFNHVVRWVKYNPDTDDFTVIVEDLKVNAITEERFTHVIVAVGIFNVPHKPTFEGIETFPGQILHCHDFRNAQEYKGQNVLVIGAHYSAEDIALQCIKFGAKTVKISYRTKPLGYDWPKNIKEYPLIKEIKGSMIEFIDGSSAEVDVIIMCTGYRYHFPFLNADLRLESHLSFYPAGLYKGMIWLNGGNNKLFYMGVVDQFYTFTMFDAQGLWITRFIMKTAPNIPDSTTEMKADAESWVAKVKELKIDHEEADFQTEYFKDLISGTDYDVRSLDQCALFHHYLDTKNDILTYREVCYQSVFTGVWGTKAHKPWMEAFDDSVAAFVN